MNIENIPAALKASGRYCYWKYEERPGGGKPAKVPYSPRTGAKLQVNDLNQYGTYADVEGYAAMGYDGIGISIVDGICAIDIDHCLNDGTWSDSTLVQTIKSLLDENPAHCWSGPAKELHKAMDDLSALSWTPQKIGFELSRLQPLLSKYDNIIYDVRTNGNAGKVYEFRHQTIAV